MSVKGEFVRIVGDAIVCLRDVGTDPAEALASDLERAREVAAADLSRAASRVVELWDDEGGARLARGPEARDRLQQAAERMLAVSKIILGR